MPNGFRKVRYRVAEKDEEELREVGTRGFGFRGLGRTREIDGTRREFHNDETAARHFASRIFERDERRPVRALTSPESSRVVPDLELEKVQEVPQTATRLVHFRQTRDSIPVFGSRVVVELDQERELVDLEAEVGEVQEVSPIASLSPEEARGRLAERLEVEADRLGGTAPPALRFYYDEGEEAWHLAWYFREVPAAPPEEAEAARERRSEAHPRALSPRELEPRYDYLLDAHEGRLGLLPGESDRAERQDRGDPGRLRGGGDHVRGRDPGSRGGEPSPGRFRSGPSVAGLQAMAHAWQRGDPR